MSDVESGAPADGEDGRPNSGENEDADQEQSDVADLKATSGLNDSGDNGADDLENAGSTAGDSDDAQSNKSLDVNLACKLIDFKLSSAGQQESSAMDGASPGPAAARMESEGSPSDEFQHTCTTCKKSFRHAATLNRHLKSHIQEAQAEEATKKHTKGQQEPPRPMPSSSPKASEGEPDIATPEKDASGGGSVETSGAEEDEREREKEQDEHSDEEEDSGSSESKGTDGENGASGKTDKRKKICTMCSKRFWSLQDLTRHMRSHTGERPFKCQTCERTFTLKHSLVRHQRIHQKPQDSKGLEAEDDDEELAKEDLGSEEVEGFPCVSGSESDSTPCSSSNPAAESEMESEKMESSDNHQVEKDAEENEEVKEEKEEEEEEEKGELVIAETEKEEEEEEETGEAVEEETEAPSGEPSKESNDNNGVSSESQPGGASELCASQSDDLAEAEKQQESTQ